MKARKYQVKSWMSSKLNNPSLHNMQAGRNILDYTWRHLIRAESSIQRGREVVEVCTDISKFFDSVDFNLLLSLLDRLHYPMCILRLSVHMYSFPRILLFEGNICSPKIYPGRGLAAGGTFATYECAGFVDEALGRVQAASPHIIHVYAEADVGAGSLHSPKSIVDKPCTFVGGESASCSEPSPWEDLWGANVALEKQDPRERVHVH